MRPSPTAGIFRRPGRNRFRASAPDAVTALICYLVLLYAIPSDRSVAALGGAGAPAALFALVVFLWWCWYHLQRAVPSLASGSQPVRSGMFIFIGAGLASYAVAGLRTLTPAEANAMDIGILRMIAFAGVLLLATDGIPGRDRFLTLLRFLCLAGGLYATLGLLQFVTGQTFVDAISLPGLAAADVSAAHDRGGFVRAEGTARHPLEYAAVLSMILPVALTLALYDKNRSLLIRWFPVAAITVSATLSVSRSAIIGALVAVLVLIPSWQSSVRRWAAVAAVGLLAAVYAFVPGMLGAIRGLFTGQDESLESRTGSYDQAMAFIEMNPLLGRGFGTFLPVYRILDNQYLSVLIEMGIVGLIALLVVLCSAIASAVLARRRYADRLLSQLGQALAAATTSGAILLAFFDAFAFPQAAGTVFLMCGLCGAYWRLKDPKDAGPHG